MMLDEVVPGVHRHEGMGSWQLVVEDGEAIAIDAGLPDQTVVLDKALEALGRPKLRAVLLTHGHVDHIGFAEHARRTHGATVFARAEEAPALKKVLTGVKPERSPLVYARNATARSGLAQLVRGGALKPTAVTAWTPVADGETLSDLPGAPVAVATPGHTPGHTAFHLPRHGVVVTGDSVVTFDPYVGRHGPRLMARGSTWDSTRARASLERLAELDAPIALPGHGPAWRDGVAAMARQAMATEQG